MIVKGAYVEVIPELLLSAASQHQYLELTNLVGSGLTGPTNIAINFVNDIRLRFGGIIREIFNGLLASPAHVVHACVHHQANRTPHVIDKLAGA